MRDAQRRWEWPLSAVVLFAVAAVSVAVLVANERHFSKIERLIEDDTMSDEPNPNAGINAGPDYCDTWWTGDPPTMKSVYTYCRPEETEEQCEARHDEKVTRRKEACPPVPPPGS